MQPKYPIDRVEKGKKNLDIIRKRVDIWEEK